MSSNKIAEAASITAYVFGALIFLLIFLTGSIVALPLPFIHLIGGIGIQRKRVWSAYGMALYYAGQLAIVAISIARSQNIAHDLAQDLFAAIFSVGLMALFFKAGRSFAEEENAPGSRVPWIVLTAVMVLTFLLFQPFSVSSGAMEDTILAGDEILVRRIPIGKLERGDLVAFVYPPDRRQSFVKRICGVPGDRILISQKILYVNDRPLWEPYAVHRTAYMDASRDNFPSASATQIYPGVLKMLRENVVNGELAVPPGRYFILGDNRDFSIDSRYWGFVDAADIFGRAVLIYASQSQPTDATVSNRGYWTKVRWQRLFQRL